MKRGTFIVAGIDENGLGPRLGPLVVTCVRAKTCSQGLTIAEAAPSPSLARRIGDSKKLVSFHERALGEAWARAIAFRSSKRPLNPDDLIHQISLEPRENLRVPCPPLHQAQCWGAEDEHFEAESALVKRLLQDLDELSQQGIDVLEARSVLLCTKRLNQAYQEKKSRFAMDLHAMEQLVLHTATCHPMENCSITCGKVGGMSHYPHHFELLSQYPCNTVQENSACSEYKIQSIGRLRFVQDADTHHLLVCIASLVGKWIRDTLMRRIVRYHHHNDSTLPLASGYNDPITRSFIEKSAQSRQNRGLPLICFERLGKHSSIA
ncbi:hypothetical protein [Pajaroellobacter abortibovis]|uniref:hypothetical protein n=1 Tax=Pajaroellobacter abortibovis TaxID=1882918 RepID=UPI00094AE6E3|nr:hypothetical protein [Pajaroellobacter abortibovis]